MERRVLLITTEQETAASARKSLEPLGYSVVVKQRLSAGLKAMKGNEVVLLDIPEASAPLKELRSYHPEAAVLVAADGGCKGKVMEEGAYLCLDRPVDPSVLRAAVRNASVHLSLKEEVDRLKERELPRPLLGASPVIQRLLGQAEKASARDIPVLISGERGTGRVLLAQRIHDLSPKRNGPFITVEASNGALTEALFGDGSSSRGAAARADGGTLFIKDFDTPESSLRERLSAFLKDRVLGGEGSPKADVRVICSANGALKKHPLAPGFGLLLSIPPLRERPEDIEPLARHFLARAALEFRSGEKDFSRAAVKALLKRPWPGNLDELKTAVALACLVSDGLVVEERHLRAADGAVGVAVKEFLEAKLGRYLKDAKSLRNSALHEAVMSEVEKALIELVLQKTGSNQVKTASALGINRTTLRTKIKAYKIIR